MTDVIYSQILLGIIYAFSMHVNMVNGSNFSNFQVLKLVESS